MSHYIRVFVALKKEFRNILVTINPAREEGKKAKEEKGAKGNKNLAALVTRDFPENHPGADGALLSINPNKERYARTEAPCSRSDISRPYIR